MTTARAKKAVHAQQGLHATDAGDTDREPTLSVSADRPLCGYVRADSRTTDDDLAQSVSNLAVFAADTGHELSTVIVEWTDDARAAFDAAAAELVGISGLADITGHGTANSAGPTDLVTNSMTSSITGRGPLLLACTHAGRP